MSIENPRPILAGKKALIVGIANEDSIAYGCAKAFREVGAEVAITYLNEKARPHVEPLANDLGASIFAPLDVAKPGELEALFARIDKEWGQLDIMVHSIASAKKEDIKGKLVDCSADGFAFAMDVSVHSFIRMARLSAPLMKDGGTMFAMSYHGATCETCNLPVYDWGQEDAPQGGHCADCYDGICAREGCAAEPPQADERVIDGLCWECASLRYCPEYPEAIKAANMAVA